MMGLRRLQVTNVSTYPETVHIDTNTELSETTNSIKDINKRTNSNINK